MIRDTSNRMPNHYECRWAISYVLIQKGYSYRRVCLFLGLSYRNAVKNGRLQFQDILNNRRVSYLSEDRLGRLIKILNDGD